MSVNDAMVLIHLAKTTLLESSCEALRPTVIPPLVCQEATRRAEEFPDAQLISSLVAKGKISVVPVRGKKSLQRLHQLNLQGGEAQAIALYWQERADLLATDDDAVRKKKVLLAVNIIGTPAVLVHLYKRGFASREKLHDAVSTLKDVGWFHPAVLDKVLEEVEHG